MSLEDELTRERGKDTQLLATMWLIWLAFILFSFVFVISLTVQLGVLRLLLIFAIFLFIPYRPYQVWIKIQYVKLISFLNKLLSGIFKLLVILVVGALIIWSGWKILIKVVDWIIPDEWTLMVCEEKLNKAECSSNSYVIPGFKSQKDCMLEGATRFAKQGFECGSNCRVDDYGLKICKVICNSSGCNE